jgi:mannose-6-phosphate isomerase-like protein (cupin superfamily)
MTPTAPQPQGPPNDALPASSYPLHRRLVAPGETSAELLFDCSTFAVLSASHAARHDTPDLNVDKDSDRMLIVLDGDLAIQIGTNRFRLDKGDAVRIPRGTRFGRTRSERGAQLLLIRTKAPRSFTLVR